MNEELKKIKKKYGEELMHLCKKLFPTILETPNLLYIILEENFGFSKMLASDIIENNLISDFRNYINSFTSKLIGLKEVEETPEELLKKAGYNLYECKTEEDIQKFKKYYKSGEELCTFNGGRLNRCYVFFAVKSDAQKIKREDFQNPKRQDEYGTSVISIQFSRGDNNTLSIKNRYNHTVNNPDATYNNNLENIIPGLTKSFEKHYKLNINSDIYNESSFLTDELQYVLGSDNKYYRYNMEINNIYYCENNIIIDNGELITKYNKEKERYILADYFIIDKKEKNITLYDEEIKDSFIDTINKIGKIKDIIETKEKEITIIYEDLKEVKIKLDKANNIEGYINDYIEEIENNFLIYNEEVKNIKLPKVKYIKDKFLFYNERLKTIDLPNVEEIENNFLSNNEDIEEIHFLKLKKIADNFLQVNRELKEVYLPNVVIIGDNFFIDNALIEKVDMPNIETVGNDFLYSNELLKYVNFSKLKEIGNNFMFCNRVLKNIKLISLKKIGFNFLYYNNSLKYIYLPKVEEIGKNFLKFNLSLVLIEIPIVNKVDNNFLHYNEIVKVKKLNK